MQTPTSGTVTGRYVKPFSPTIHRFGPYTYTRNLPSKRGYLFRRGTNLIHKQEDPFLTQADFTTVAQAGDLVLILSPGGDIPPKLHSYKGDGKNKWRRLQGREDLINQLQVLALIQ